MTSVSMAQSSAYPWPIPSMYARQNGQVKPRENQSTTFRRPR
jgi:hypothetical protein